MGIDPSAIGGIGYKEPISTWLSFWQGHGFFLDLTEDDDFTVDTIRDTIKLPGVEFLYTFGYGENELFAFVIGNNIIELYNNTFLYIESMKSIGIEISRKELTMNIIPFLS
jgi:hypothetical protein